MIQPNYPWVITLTLLFIVPTGMLAYCAPRRPHFWQRVSISVVAALLVFGVIDTINMSNPAPTVFDLSTYLPSIIGFGVGSVALIVLSYLCFDMSIWVASFCGTAGYICQNMANSLGNILWNLLKLEAINPRLCVIGGAIIAYLAIYLLMVRPVRRYGLTGVDNHRMLLMTVAVIFVNIVASLTLGSLEGLGMPPAGIIILHTLHLTTCTLMLYLEYEMLYHRRMLREIETTERVLEERARQYELSRENIDAINVKCHDIRHQIRRLKDGATATVVRATLADIAREVDIYDSTVKTGNDALDTILTEKSLVCEAESIALSCIADGNALGFMMPADIYAFFGNVLDNAIEAERALEDPGDRSISLVVRETAGMASIHVENYFTGEASFVDGLPQTTKGDTRAHGFGTKSMRLIAERYDGTLSMGIERNTFFVNALIPIPA